MLLTNDLGADGKAAELAMQDPNRLKQLPILDVRLALLGLTLLDNYVQTRIWYQLDTASLVSPTPHFGLLECTLILLKDNDKSHLSSRNMLISSEMSRHT